ncbi:CopL family metal-binding regulatory protein [Xanthomonas campestris pv. raphani]|uniref:CopL family metal-binding regulatory protein n=1 Tax=Xanthomonas campestris TaxID=339 RepID=UPI002B236178|nr:CopL family metal-binding regulatory protein [Xanthomonas campestris]MEA9912707.1 CopL family metal-binding regulatory protein [Xanthomonas campestris pv. raphani]
MPHCLLRLLLCLCLVANTATGAWASVGMAMPAMGSAAMGSEAMAATAHGVHAAAPDALPCHEDMASPAAMPLPDTDHAPHAGKGDCCKLGSCDCLQHCSLALLTLPAVPAALAGRPAMPGALAEGRANPVPEQPVRPPIA